MTNKQKICTLRVHESIRHIQNKNKLNSYYVPLRLRSIQNIKQKTNNWFTFKSQYSNFVLYIKISEILHNLKDTSLMNRYIHKCRLRDWQVDKTDMIEVGDSLNEGDNTLINNAKKQIWIHLHCKCIKHLGKASKCYHQLIMKISKNKTRVYNYLKVMHPHECLITRNLKIIKEKKLHSILISLELQLFIVDFTDGKVKKFIIIMKKKQLDQYGNEVEQVSK